MPTIRTPISSACSPAPPLERQAFAGLREMAMFFYYCDERAWPRIHYDGPLVSMPSKPEADSALIEKERKT